MCRSNISVYLLTGKRRKKIRKLQLTDVSHYRLNVAWSYITVTFINTERKSVRMKKEIIRPIFTDTGRIKEKNDS